MTCTFLPWQECPLCLKGFGGRKSLQVHIDFHRSRAAKVERKDGGGGDGGDGDTSSTVSVLDTPVDCPQCGETIGDKFQLNDHYRAGDNPELPRTVMPELARPGL